MIRKKNKIQLICMTTNNIYISVRRQETFNRPFRKSQPTPLTRRISIDALPSSCMCVCVCHSASASAIVPNAHGKWGRKDPKDIDHRNFRRTVKVFNQIQI